MATSAPVTAGDKDSSEGYRSLVDPAEIFTYFTEKAWDVPQITGSFSLLKEKLGIAKEAYGVSLYHSLKSKLTHWKAKTLWELLDKKVQLSEYNNQKACQGTSVCVVGCGPIGMRFAIEAALLGCDIVVVEKRPYFSRNNVLHLWPFTIDDLKRLGAKKFYGQFCAGSLDHISIRSLQSILLKTSLMFGVRIYFGIEFVKIKEPGGGRAWHADFLPSNHPLNDIDFSVLVGAEGKNSRIPGFDRKELRAKLALAITANFINHRTQEEAAVQEISGVAFIFNQKFFKDLREDTGIDLENIVYYRDDTHYFIMTAKKDSLLDKGVLIKDYPDVQQLLAPSNRNMKAMCEYAIEAADWSTELPQLDFARNHKGQPDVDLFDFTSIYQAEYAARAVSRDDTDLLICLVGDSLVQPFWPQGTGCARGFLSAMDAAWMVRGFGEGRKVLELLAERESLFQRLTQTKPDNLSKKFSAYTIDPRTRYPNLVIGIVKPANVKHLYDFDGELDLTPPPPQATPPLATPPSTTSASNNVPLTPPEITPTKVAPAKPKRAPSKTTPTVTTPPNDVSSKATPTVATPIINTTPKGTPTITPKRVAPPPPRPLRKTPSRPVNEAGHITRALYGTPESDKVLADKQVIMKWFKEELKDYPNLRFNDLARTFRDGMVLCSLIHHYNPAIIPQFSSLSSGNQMSNNKLAFSLLEKHFNIPQLIKPSEMDNPDRLTLFTYLSSVYETFLNLESVPLVSVTATAATPGSGSKKGKLARKLSRKNSKSLLSSSPADSWGTDTNSLRRSLSPNKKEQKSRREKKEKVQETIKEKEEKETTPPPSKGQAAATGTETNAKSKQQSGQGMNTPKSAPNVKKTGPRPISTFGSPAVASDICFFCNKRVYLMEKMSANNVFFHRNCFRCSHCNSQLNLGNFAMSKGDNGAPGKFFCKPHYRQLFMANPEAINYARSQPEKDTSLSPPPTSPTNSNLPPISEDEVAPAPASSVVPKDDEEVSEARERKRTLTQKFSDMFRRRPSRSSSKSPSPEKTIAKPKKDENPILFESPPTPTEESPVTTPTTVTPTVTPSVVVTSDASKSSPFRKRSTKIRGRPGTTPPPGSDDAQHLLGSKKRRGQASLVRPIIAVQDEEDDIAVSERQKQQERFREAQEIQREMSQIELQYDELEDIAREIEQNLRDAEGTEQEDNFMKAWLNLVSERNALVRRTADLSLQMKLFGLEDRQYELQKEMRELQERETEEEEGPDPHFESLLEELVDVVQERDQIIQQVESDRIRELDELAAEEEMMSHRFGEGDSPSRKSATMPAEGGRKERKDKRTSWWPW